MPSVDSRNSPVFGYHMGKWDFPAKQAWKTLADGFGRYFGPHPSGQHVHRKKLRHIALAKQAMFAAQRCSNMNFQMAIKNGPNGESVSSWTCPKDPKHQRWRHSRAAFSKHFAHLQLPLLYDGLLGHKTATLYYTQVETSMA